MRLFAAITLIAVASSSTIHRPTGVTESTGIGIVFRTVFAVGKRCAISGERGIVRYKCAVGCRAIWVRAAWAVAFAWLAISAIASTTTTAITPWAASAFLLFAVRTYGVRVCDGCAVCAWC